MKIETEIQRFLASKEPEVLCIRGKWGVGKTYAWKQFLKRALGENTVLLDQYSYVSLFGVSSLADLRRATFENIVSLRLSESPSATSVGRSLARWQELTRKGFRGALQLMPLVKNASEALASATFMLVHDQIVCFDDLERVGKGLRTKDVLGMVSYLKEEKQCKVVLLLNDQKMKKAARNDFNEQLEKVVDVNIEFAPTPIEAARIGLKHDSSYRDQLSDALVKLQVANIRTIKRVERLADHCLAIVDGLHENVHSQVIQTVALAGWAKKLQPSDAPSLEYIRHFNAYSAAFREFSNAQDAAHQDEQKKEWNATLNKLDFTNSDELDVAIIDGIDVGYFDRDRIRIAAEKIDVDHRQGGRGSAYSQAWQLYHASLRPNDAEVLDAIFDAVRQEPDAITPMNVNAAITLFREIGREAQASEMVKIYVEGQAPDKHFFDLANYPFAGDVTDPELREAFAVKYASFQDARDPADVLRECATRSGWNREDAELLGTLSVDDLVAVFENLDGEDTTTILKMALRFGEPSPATGKLISENAADALRLIAAKSPLNRRRVQGLGVTFPEENDGIALDEQAH